MGEIEDFRAEARAWIEENCPAGARGPGQIANGSTRIELEPDVRTWLERCVERGWTTPGWPTEYGGGGLEPRLAQVVAQEMAAARARPPLQGMGTTMIGPTLLEFGTEAQKQRHLPKIVRGELQWCQGYSEPGAGSDLAALRTRCEDRGDHFVLNGQKIWTSGASTADWMFAIVRTDFDVPKHEGISFVLLPMDQPGVTVKPIRLISGSSPFCETFFDDAVAAKEDLVGELNKGWTVGKRLLQFERSGIGGLSGGGRARGTPGGRLVELAKHYLGETDGRIGQPVVREKVLRHAMRSQAFRLTAQRVNEENRAGTPGAATSIFKLVGATLQRDGADLARELLGSRGVIWEGGTQQASERDITREWLASRATTIYGGTNEIQMNIIAKRVLGLPD
ncbi:MAG: acyl-CoA dehydrogenase family protein [Pseudomonadales bacterium]|jgi:alkylation response protein AidB-like acyl-CoA dehydrogenase|nr:acyl-CoA dehydrogenase family protein [Pseudomonadales bacterium]